MTARDFDKAFDAGKDVTCYLDLLKTRRTGHEQKRVNVDFPIWMVESLDREASCLGGTNRPHLAPIECEIADLGSRPVDYGRSKREAQGASWPTSASIESKYGPRSA
jgi:hypothetical protein